MIYQSDALTVKPLDNGLAELNFDLQGDSVNKFNQKVVESLAEALDVLEQRSDIKGLLLTSSKPVFFVGADITEFVPLFGMTQQDIMGFTKINNRNFRRLEQLPYPTCVAINGYAVGGGLEVCLACDFRVMSTQAKIGLPETKLGIIPGWGGTVRLPRIIGLDEAATWIATGQDQRADKAIRVGAVDAVAEPNDLRDVAISTLMSAVDGGLDFHQRRVQKTSPLPMNDTEAGMAFFTMKALVMQQAGKNYPAPVAAITAMEKARKLSIDDALMVESSIFAELAIGPVAKALVGVFLSDQLLGKKSKKWEKQADKKIRSAAVLGAGIMGGGIAYQSAYKGVPIKMKDINQAGLDLGMSEAAKLLTKRVSRGRMKPEQMAATLNAIQPTLNYDNFDGIDICVEAVVENPKIKHAVLAETEKVISADTVLASNTSTISITYLAEALQRPENFVGMHFFNPVHAMPLVEVIRGEKSSDAAVARTVAYANAMGKKAVVVKDCPGFLVNRVLFPYFDGFSRLLKDGADFQQVDKVMEKWGWPMGPAYLLDVVGIDTAYHCADVMAKGFPTRMKMDFKAAPAVMFEANRYGQKNGLGFFEYTKDSRGKPKKEATAVAYELLSPHCAERREFSEEEIVARMMLPMATELARCLEEGIVETAAEADLALIYGLGFPPFRGGVFRWVDTIGMKALAAMSDKFGHLGESYQLTEGMQVHLSSGSTYY